jgi:predicted ATPase with chaperone activity
MTTGTKIEQSGRPAFWPPTPDRIDDLGIPKPMVVELALRHIRVQGTSSLRALSRSMKLPIGVVESLYHYFRQQQFLDVEGMVGEDYSFRLTSKARELVSARSQLGNYAGPTPVSVEAYYEAVRAQIAKPLVTRERLREVFHDLVVPASMLDQLGPALISHRSLFLYGPTGNGKTSIAERLLRVYTDNIVVPHAISVDGHIVTLFDPVVHRELDLADDYLDQRWAVCRRPCITTGGELVPGMLELRLDQAAGIYAAPLQMKANNGIFLIDDFGRQVMSPRELLNRWIVPLDRRVDYLTLSHGVKFQIPFEMLVVFSTNLEPRELADEAFLRRIHTKVYIEAVGAEAFDQILARVVERAGVACDPEIPGFLRRLCLDRSSALRACYPVDICDIMASICTYEGRPLRITREEIGRAAELYFTKNI